MKNPQMVQAGDQESKFIQIVPLPVCGSGGVTLTPWQKELGAHWKSWESDAIVTFAPFPVLSALTARCEETWNIRGLKSLSRVPLHLEEWHLQRPPKKRRSLRIRKSQGQAKVLLKGDQRGDETFSFWETHLVQLSLQIAFRRRTRFGRPLVDGQRDWSESHKVTQSQDAQGVKKGIKTKGIWITE